MSLAILTTVFNADRESVRLSNLKSFIDGLGKASQFLHIAECRSDRKPFILQHLPNVRCLRAKSNIWQKERLLNLLLDNIQADAVAWLDADLIFRDPNWWRLALRQLEDVDVLQPFSHVENQTDELENTTPGFCWTISADNSASEKRFNDHGHTGYAWVIKRELIKKVGFYDACIIGGADHVIAHGFLGQLDSECVPPLLDDNGPQFNRYSEWIDKLGTLENPFRTGFVDGIVKHLPHGSSSGRQYMLRNRLLRESSFDPSKHLAMNSDGCWEWTMRAYLPRLVVNKYLKSRVVDERT